MNKLLSSLPKVDVLLNEKRIKVFLDKFPRNYVLDVIRTVVDSYRKRILSGNIQEIDIEEIIRDICNQLEINYRPSLRRVINATGTVIHTNLGRAPISKYALEQVMEIGERYNNLEYNLDEGKRGSRYSHVEHIICKLTGAEAAMVVNNNAAAVLLVLSTIAKNKEVIVSRGQLVEIGGSFRIPLVMEQSGAILKEIGTTNRTHLYDYECAINENTAALLKVHQSNYRILGFTEEVSLDELVVLKEKYKLPLIEDIGSGVLIDLSKYGLNYEPTVQNSIKKGVDVVTFSGDKLLGGPQAGIIVGKKELIQRMKKNQLTRALRIDKFTLAALEATLNLYLDEERAVKDIPILNMLTLDYEELRRRANKLLRILKRAIKEDRAKITVREDYSTVGGGAMPLEIIPTFAVFIEPKNKKVEKIEEELRKCQIPVVVRVGRNSIILDVRTLFEDDYTIIKNNLDGIL
ncbi:L-seryl-tRNA(Sec) selenium transferase [Caloramator proteoclasticus]|uniref:L-seryl-tRNA(Sec) selenium transferase n=1 Tax=Caloramator proteoclasticus DSM 10124 TaxID=1121262 RepID=A0A1M4TKI4_9CLOT|nr:L-seryl-tRNA(Sec) selenium transferase [Caloramator proteoclasticus]SHE44797.1 L-seryl-tRNA(Sec) selenium transferase [Caloramator proteoclasticus DSM 10124]